MLPIWGHKKEKQLRKMQSHIKHIFGHAFDLSLAWAELLWLSQSKRHKTLFEPARQRKQVRERERRVRESE